MANPASSPSPPLSPTLPLLISTSRLSSIDSHRTRFPPFSSPRVSSLQPFSDLRSTTKEVVKSMQVQPVYTQGVRDCPCSDNGGGMAALACEECVHECPDDPCSVELGSECTEQCVVVACTDAHHDAATCVVASSVEPCEPCEMTCSNGADCTGLDEFFRCCSDYHEYLSEPRSFSSDIVSANHGFIWDPSFAALLCDCSESPHFAHGHASGHFMSHASSESSTSQLAYAQASGSNTSSVPSTLSTPQLTPSPVVHPIPDPSVQPSPIPPHRLTSMQSSHFEPQLPQFYPSPMSSHVVHKCQWGGCFASFSSLGELVGHVNLQHLRLPSASELAPMLPVQQPAADTTANELSCLWADCQVYPTPQSIPGPSTGTSVDSVRILASHLLEDHLGLPTRSPKQAHALADAQTPGMGPSIPIPMGRPFPIPSVPSSRLASPVSSEPSSQGPPTPLPEHDCSLPSAHVCRWSGCTESFASCDALTQHITATHVGFGRAHYDCYWDACTRHGDNGFSSKQKILRHLQSHTGHRPFQCKVCHQNFSEAATLAQHMRRHTQEKPYLCDFPGCGKAFAITGALTIHKRTHNGHKPFKCTYCDRAFAESSNLSKHLRTHTGARPYQCLEPGCSKSFARPDQLARHQNVHKKKLSAENAVALVEAT